MLGKEREQPVKTEWIVIALTALGMVVSGVYFLTTAEGRVTTRLTTIETSRGAEGIARERLVGGYDQRIAALEEESVALRHELSIRREYQRHVHGHICALLSRAHGPETAETEEFCALPEPEFTEYD